MTRRLGPDCKLRAYQRWESGESIPRAEQLIKLINLLPDTQTISDFGISIAESEVKPKGGGLKLERKLRFPRGPGSDEVL